MMIKKNLLLLCLGLFSTASQTYAIDRYNVIAPVAGLLLGITNQYLVYNMHICSTSEPRIMAGGMLLSSLPEIIKKTPKITPESTVKEYQEAKVKMYSYIIKNVFLYGIGYGSGNFIGDFLFKPIK